MLYITAYIQAQSDEKKIEEMRRARVDNSMVECSFTPKILHSSKSKKNGSDSKSDKKPKLGIVCTSRAKRSIEKKKKLVEDDKIRLKNLSNTHRGEEGGL